MPRKLRACAWRPDYAALNGANEYTMEGPSGVHGDEDPLEEGSSQGKAVSKRRKRVSSDEEFAMAVDDIDAAEKVPKGKGKRQPKPKVPMAEASKTTTTSKEKTSIVRAAPARMNVLPLPSINHRRRAVPLNAYANWVERLNHPPKLCGFGPVQSILTDEFHRDQRARDRSTRMWEYNCGAGPLWELIEDRAWFKEGQQNVKDEERRPLVYKNLLTVPGFEQLDEAAARPYLPTGGNAMEGGDSASPMSCAFGPQDSQTKVEMKILETQKMSEYFKGNQSHVMNAGAPIWGLDWCPIHPSGRSNRNYKHYLAVAPMPSSSHAPEIGRKVSRPTPACVQIWSLEPIVNTTVNDSNERVECTGSKSACQMVLCLDCGPALEIKWCPLPAHDTDSSAVRPRKLGLLAGTFEDGSLSIFTVPDPQDFTPIGVASDPIYLKVTPLIRIELEETACWALDWANSEVIATGTTNGSIAVYNIKNAIEERNDNSACITTLLPTHYINVHQSAIRALTWLRAPTTQPPHRNADPTTIASGGYDGVQCLLDIRDGHKAIMNRTRDVINTISFSPYLGGPITTDHENTIKSYCVSPSMIGRGHTLLEPDGPVWNISTSDYHPHIAIASSDGSCYTTNGMKSTRKSAKLPQFVYKLFQLDYSRNTGEYRMLEHFLPQETVDRLTTVRRSKKDKTPVALPAGTGAWPVEVGVNRVTWHNGAGMGSCGLLASGTASGLCRIDWLTGRWLKGKMPFRKGFQGSDEDEDEAQEEEAEADDASDS